MSSAISSSVGRGGGTGSGYGSSDISGPSPPAAPVPVVKRTRVLLSCHSCRASKLKCDRAHPCGQCLKKGRPDDCKYAPRPEKNNPAKSMAARLKRLEGMVRGMLDGEGIPVHTASENAVSSEADADAGGPGGQVVQGSRATSYVGGTHFMAILEDIDELKNYFEEPEEDSPEPLGPYETAASPEFVLLSTSVPRTKEDLLAMLPEKSVIDRLVLRYFTSNSPSQHVIHRPIFNKEYHQFWQDPSKTSLNWIALLFMITSLGIFFSSFQAPHELECDSNMPALDRFRQYRDAAGWALIYGKYTQPTLTTLQAFVLYVESEFIWNRRTQMNCYLLAGTLIRLMLKMGLHRDPSKLPNISPYDGEMRRRLWNLAVQIDLLVAFHIGMPAMIHGIESDTSLPLNFYDEDFDENTKELPAPRSDADYTHMTYAINKAAICRVFGLVARQAHALKTPTYAEVMKVDTLLQEVWDKVPQFMKVKPLEECVTDPPMLVVQRFGLASLYQKSCCVLHRRYLTDPAPKKEHEYSRRTCLEAALALMNYQITMAEACKPGAMLHRIGWFVSALAINDFLLADLVIALVIQTENYEGGGDYDWLTPGTPTPTKEELLQLLKTSHSIWQEMASKVPGVEKAYNVVATIFKRVQAHCGAESSTAPSTETSAPTSNETGSMAGLTIGGTASTLTPISEGLSDDDWQAFPKWPAPAIIYNQNQQSSANDNNWMMFSNANDWVQFDVMTRSEADVLQQPAIGQIPASWFDNNPIDEMDFIAASSWNRQI